MTICIGILASDGVVVAADTEEISGYLKSSQPKIITVGSGIQLGKTSGSSLTGGACIIAGAGDAGYIDSLKMELADVFLDNKKLVHKPLQKAVEKCVRDFHVNHVIPFGAFPRSDRPEVEMLIGIQRGPNSMLLATEKSTVRKVMPYEAIGMGSVFAKILLQKFWKLSSVKITQILAAYIVFMAKESVESCGKFTTITTLHGWNMVDSPGGSKLFPPTRAISHMNWQEIDDLETIFRSQLLRAEQEALWGIITQAAIPVRPLAHRKSKGQQ
jgi:hypothetical protein